MSDVFLQRHTVSLWQRKSPILWPERIATLQQCSDYSGEQSRKTTNFSGRNSLFSPAFTERKLFFISSQSLAIAIAIPIKLT